MKTNTWKNIRGELTLEIALDDDGHICDLQSEVGCGNQDLEFLRCLIPDPKLNVEIVINFLSSGSYTPMSMYGGPDDLGWPEECEDEREFDSADILVDGKIVSMLPHEIGMKLFKLFESRIAKIELEYDRNE